MQAYEDETGKSAPRVSFGSSGLLATQIINGAPFELFLSADRASIDRLPEGALHAKPEQFAAGDIRLAVPVNSPLASKLSMETLSVAFTNRHDGRSLRLAMPNPLHAPYGKAAQQALVNSGIWPLQAQQLLTAENAAQTLQFVRSGAVDAAIVPQALLIAQSDGVISVPIPAGLYTAIEHTLALHHKATESARYFAAWIQNRNAASVLEAGGLRVVQDPAKSTR